MTASAYTKMTNIVWDLHFYGWGAKYSTDPAVVNATLMGLVDGGYGIAAAQSITGAGGAKIPVIVGEFGDSTDGVKIDRNGRQVIDAVLNSGYGFAAWVWESESNCNELTRHGALTAYGHQVAAGIAAAASRTPPHLAK